MLGRNYFDVLPNEAHRALFEQVIKTGSPYEAREQPSVLSARSGRGVTYWNGSINCVKDGTGAVQGIVLSMTDLTDEIHARQEISGLRVVAERRAEELAASEERVVNIIESISDGFVALDRDERFTYVNKEAELLLRRSRNKLLGKRICESFPRLIDSRFYEACEKAIAEQVAVTAEEYVPWLAIWLEYRVSPSSDGLLISFRDITERRQAEEERCRYLSSLGALVGVSAKVLAETTVPGLLKSVLEAAMDLTKARTGVSAFGNEQEVVHVCKATLNESLQIYETTGKGCGGMNELCCELISDGSTIRLTREQLAENAAMVWIPQSHPSLDGLLGAPLSGYADRARGMIALSAKMNGNFTSEDEALLSQLAMIASLGLQHIQARDSAEKRAEEAEEGRRILDALIEHVPEGLVIADGPDIKVRMASRYVRELTGCANETWDNPGLFKSLWSLYHLDGVTPADSEELPLSRAIHNGEVVTGQEWMFFRPDGEPVTISCNAGPIKDRDGNVSGGVVAWRDISMLRSAREDLENDLERKCHIADTLQRSLIPDVEINLPHLAVFGDYRPAFDELEVGGDFYDVFDVEGGRLALVMGDVSGKGLEAAVHTAAAKYMLRAYAYQDPEPSHVLERLNNALCLYTPECLFVTIFYGLLDLKTRKLVYTSAGHDEPLHYNSKLRCAIPLDVTGRAVGIIPHSEYSQRVLQLDSDDILLIYTDGVSDARCQGRFFGAEGLTEVLVANAHQDERTIANILLATASDFQGGRLKDDAAILVVKAKGGVT
jgi:PAS domain S-box-containing protein